MRAWRITAWSASWSSVAVSSAGVGSWSHPLHDWLWRFDPNTRDETVHRLTARERAVVALLADGLVHRAVGARLGISRHTVARHVQTACSKLGITGGGRALVAYLTERSN